ncbi:MAG: PadR family transcriptional regulator [Acholeplasmataceae bacterium]|jgi:PadR family transcriptional regulator PadR
MNIQYKKGVLDLLVFAMLNKKDQYGYDISETISRKIEISPGTIYPILRKMKDDGFVTTYLSEMSGGPARKYYKLTPLGLNHFQKLKSEWDELAEITHFFLEETND